MPLRRDLAIYAAKGVLRDLECFRAQIAMGSCAALAWHSRKHRRTERFSAAQDAASQPHCLGCGAAGLERAPEVGAGALAAARSPPRAASRSLAAGLQPAATPVQVCCYPVALLCSACRAWLAWRGLQQAAPAMAGC